jgi:phosphatidylserine decarboxylase
VDFARPGLIDVDDVPARVAGWYSALIHWGSRRELPTRLRPLAYRAFARAVGANLDEAELDLAAYPSLGEFFVRRLRAGARTIDAAADAVVSPCDGVVAAAGAVTAGALVQAKGKDYTLEELVADERLAARLEGGAYVTIYLSPRDYHRVHSPVAGQIVGYHYVPGALWPVSPRFAARRDRLLARNERVVIEVNSPSAGRVAIVMVAATGVGNMRLVHGPDSAATIRGVAERRRVELDASVARGGELGAFWLGSTVVLVFEPGKVDLAPLVAGAPVRFGERLGRERA